MSMESNALKEEYIYPLPKKRDITPSGYRDYIDKLKSASIHANDGLGAEFLPFIEDRVSGYFGIDINDTTHPKDIFRYTRSSVADLNKKSKVISRLEGGEDLMVGSPGELYSRGEAIAYIKNPEHRDRLYMELYTYIKELRFDWGDRDSVIALASFLPEAHLCRLLDNLLTLNFTSIHGSIGLIVGVGQNIARLSSERQLDYFIKIISDADLKKHYLGFMINHLHIFCSQVQNMYFDIVINEYVWFFHYQRNQNVRLSFEKQKRIINALVDTNQILYGREVLINYVLASGDEDFAISTMNRLPNCIEGAGFKQRIIHFLSPESQDRLKQASNINKDVIAKQIQSGIHTHYHVLEIMPYFLDDAKKELILEMLKPDNYYNEAVNEIYANIITLEDHKLFIEVDVMRINYRAYMDLLRLYNKLGNRVVYNARHKKIYKKIPAMFDDPNTSVNRERFDKSGSDTLLLGGGMSDKVIVRIISSQAFDGWSKAFQCEDRWEEAGFDYIPIEPIVSFRCIDKQFESEGLGINKYDDFGEEGQMVIFSPLAYNKGDYIVYSGVLDNSIDGFEFRYPFMAKHMKEIHRKKIQILKILDDINVVHGHPHSGNFCIQFYRNEDGSIDTERCPRVYLIDFDASQSVQR